MRDRGWATSEAEVDDGVWAAAAIVKDGTGLAGALSVAGPAYRLDEAKREAILARVREAASRLSRELAALDAYRLSASSVPRQMRAPQRHAQRRRSAAVWRSSRVML